jgi:L-seryl-tRNA(Ser) seleniumtransferase
MNRRGALGAIGAVSAVGAGAGASRSGRAKAAAPRRNFLKELGVRPVINGAGVYTMFTGSLMHPAVIEAMRAVADRFVRLDEIHDAVGAKIAKLLRCEAALVSSGAAAALTLGTAACVAGDDPDGIRRLPDTTGMKNEVIIQRAHRYPYDHAVRNAGVRLIEVETSAELEGAISTRTAMLLFLNKAEPLGKISGVDFVAAGKRHGIPTCNDAAADVPPVENLWKLTGMGFDLVAFSGGKGIRGPQSAGLLLGRKGLISAARLHTGASSDSLGRSLKVNKEEMVGMMVALEVYLARDHAADWRTWEKNISDMERPLAKLPGVKLERFVPVIANQVPHLRVSWDTARIPLLRPEVVRRLAANDPAIEPVPPLPPDLEKNQVEIASWMLQPGEPAVIGRCLAGILGPSRA